jgi:hypothetical protein
MKKAAKLEKIRNKNKKRRKETGMKLMTKEIAKTLPSYKSIKSWKSEDEVIAYTHYWLGSFDWYLVAGSPITINDDGTWYFTKNENDASDWLLYVKGFSHMCPEGEYGEMFLSDLKQYSIGSYIKVERAVGWKSKPIKECGQKN